MKVISLPYIFQVLYVLCFTEPRYQVSVYRTIGPLVLLVKLNLLSLSFDRVLDWGKGGLVPCAHNRSEHRHKIILHPDSLRKKVSDAQGRAICQKI